MAPDPQDHMGLETSADALTPASYRGDVQGNPRRMEKVRAWKKNMPRAWDRSDRAGRGTFRGIDRGKEKMKG